MNLQSNLETVYKIFAYKYCSWTENYHFKILWYL